MRLKLIPSLGGLLLVCVLSAAAHAANMKPISLARYDGAYLVEITTTEGSCDKMFRGSVTISNARITALSEASATAEGGIENDGTVSLMFRENGQIVNAGGRLGPRYGRGTWSSPTAQCGGWWRAERQQ